MIDIKDIDTIVERIISAEGGFVNDPDDRGGATNFGITQATLEAYRGTTQYYTDVRDLSKREAAEIYKTTYVEPFAQMFNKTIFNFVVNMAVQHGVLATVKMIQRVVEVKDDGVAGSNTWRSIAVAEGYPEIFLARLVAERCRYYTSIVDRKPTQIKFLKGWVNRIAKDLS
jgi:lysozyme family protein